MGHKAHLFRLLQLREGAAPYLMTRNRARRNETSAEAPLRAREFPFAESPLSG